MSLDESERARRMLAALATEGDEPERWFWLSFCDGDRPAGTQFLGACIVKARGIATAVREAHRLGCNPGGEVKAVEIPPDRYPKEPWINRLLTKEEALSEDLDVSVRTPPEPPR